jgi:hypothetical protein
MEMEGQNKFVGEGVNASALRRALEQACKPPFFIEELGSCYNSKS